MFDLAKLYIGGVVALKLFAPFRPPPAVLASLALDGDAPLAFD